MIPKFRAWLKNDKEMIDVRVIDWNNMIVDSFIPYIEIPLEKVILMQSTGLLDKNGKEIFEGDIIGSKDGLLNGVVLYRSDLAMWTVDLIRYNNFERLCNVASSREIIGNIHENKDILEASDDQ